MNKYLLELLFAPIEGYLMYSGSKALLQSGNKFYEKWGVLIFATFFFMLRPITSYLLSTFIK
jgi:hypothetical protein